MRRVLVHPVLLALLRHALGVALILYGAVKLPAEGGQFIYTRDWTFEAAHGQPTTLVWLFFGYAPVYGRFIGCVELLAGVLCLVPRTHRLGAMAAFPLMTNVAVMDWSFGFPLAACLLATGLAVGSLWVLVPTFADLSKVLLPPPRRD